MDLKSGYPFWAVRNGLMHAFPQLDADLRCDVAVVGGGITGARVQFAMAYGGNGITYSMIGAGLLRANIERRKHPLRQLFSFERIG